MTGLIFLVLLAATSAQEIYFTQDGRQSVISPNFPGSNIIVPSSSPQPQRPTQPSFINLPAPRPFPQPAPIISIPAPQPRPQPQVFTIPQQPLPVFQQVIGLPAPPQSQCDPIGKPLVRFL